MRRLGRAAGSLVGEAPSPGAAWLVATAAEAAGGQTVEISGEAAAASVIARLALTIRELDQQIAVITGRPRPSSTLRLTPPSLPA